MPDRCDLLLLYSRLEGIIAYLLESKLPNERRYIHEISN